jgi:hypothetical protein
VVPISGLDTVKRRDMFSPARNRTPAVQPVDRLYVKCKESVLKV